MDLPTASRFPTASKIMTPNPRTCSKFSTVLEAVLIFRDEDCGAVPIVEDGKPIGVLTDRDIALAVAEGGPDLGSRLVSDFMTEGAATVLANDDVHVIASRFADKAVRRLLVVDDAGSLLGIIAWADIAQFVPNQGLGQMVNEVVEKD